MRLKKYGTANPHYKVEHIVQEMQKFIDKSPIPMLTECCFINNWNYKYILEIALKAPEVRNEIDRMKLKQETMVTKGLLSGKIPPTSGIFQLKRLGATDKSKEEKHLTVAKIAQTRAQTEHIKKQTELLDQGLANGNIEIVIKNDLKDE